MQQTRPLPVVAFFIDFLESDEGLAGGTERQLIGILRELPKWGFRPVLFCLRGDRRALAWRSLDCEKHMLGVTSLRSGKAIQSLEQARRILCRCRARVVHTFFFDSTVFGVLAGRLARVPLVLSSRRDLGFWYAPGKLAALRIVNRLTDVILTNSQAIRTVVSRREGVPRSRIAVIHNGIDAERVRDCAPASLPNEFGATGGERPVVGIVANFNRPVKRVDLFIEAAARVHARHPETRFFIVGGGGLEAKLRRLAHRLGLGHAVVFAGPQANSLSYIKTFTIGVLCSDSEGFPNVLLEYMAASIPAVATAVGGNTELITHGVNGLLCPANDAEALAQRICELVASPARRASLARQALSTVRDEFGLDTQMKRLVALYASTSTGQLRTSPRGGGNPTCS